MVDFLATRESDLIDRTELNGAAAGSVFGVSACTSVDDSNIVSDLKRCCGKGVRRRRFWRLDDSFRSWSFNFQMMTSNLKLIMINRINSNALPTIINVIELNPKNCYVADGSSTLLILSFISLDVRVDDRFLFNFGFFMIFA